VSYATDHPADWTLELLAEEALAPAEREGVTAHVAGCARCAAEVDVYRALFSAMAELPEFSPSPTFEQSVMARVTVAKPAALPAWMIRLMPSSWQGWVVLLALCMTPAAPIAWAVWWIATHPDWSFGGLWTAGTAIAENLGWAAFVRVVGTATESRLAFWGRTLVEELAGMPPELLVFGLLVMAIGIPLSVWTLYRTLRTPTRGTIYAH
jgi:anti-sigma factor RsiW